MNDKSLKISMMVLSRVMELKPVLTKEKFITLMSEYRECSPLKKDEEGVSERTIVSDILDKLFQRSGIGDRQYLEEDLMRYDFKMKILTDTRVSRRVKIAFVEHELDYIDTEDIEGNWEEVVRDAQIL